VLGADGPIPAGIRCITCLVLQNELSNCVKTFLRTDFARFSLPQISKVKINILEFGLFKLKNKNSIKNIKKNEKIRLLSFEMR
jgi:hypothetical protein